MVEIVAEQTDQELYECCYKLFLSLRRYQLIVTAGNLAWSYWPKLESFLEELRQRSQSECLRAEAERIVESKRQEGLWSTLAAKLSDCQSKILQCHQEFEQKGWPAPSY